MTEQRSFDIGDVLTVVTGKLLSLRHMHGVYDILHYLAGEPVFTHQIPRAFKAARPVILRQYPQLREVVCDEPLEPDTFIPWLNSQKALFGEALVLVPMTRDQWESRDPVDELTEMVGEDRVVVIDPDSQLRT